MNKKLDISKLFESEYACEFLIDKPVDVLWLDPERMSHRHRFSCTVRKCRTCGGEVKCMYLYSQVSRLEQKLQGKICPICNHGSLYY